MLQFNPTELRNITMKGYATIKWTQAHEHDNQIFSILDKQNEGQVMFERKTSGKRICELNERVDFFWEKILSVLP